MDRLRKLVPSVPTALLLAAGWGLLVALGEPMLGSLVAVLAIALLLKVGWLLLRSFARPVPEPPPPGELRKVRIMFRCSVCGTEVRMTTANDEVPEPPRHCQEDMELVAPIDDL